MKNENIAQQFEQFYASDTDLKELPEPFLKTLLIAFQKENVKKASKREVVQEIIKICNLDEEK